MYLRYNNESSDSYYEKITRRWQEESWLILVESSHKKVLHSFNSSSPVLQIYQTVCLDTAFHDLSQCFNVVNRTPCLHVHHSPALSQHSCKAGGKYLYQQKVYSSCVQVQQTSAHKKCRVKNLVTYFLWKSNKLYNILRNALYSLVQIIRYPYFSNSAVSNWS